MLLCLILLPQTLQLLHYFHHSASSSHSSSSHSSSYTRVIDRIIGRATQQSVSTESQGVQHKTFMKWSLQAARKHGLRISQTFAWTNTVQQSATDVRCELPVTVISSSSWWPDLMILWIVKLRNPMDYSEFLDCFKKTKQEGVDQTHGVPSARQRHCLVTVFLMIL